MKNSKIFASSLNEAPAVTAVLQRYICTSIHAIIYMYITDHVNVLSHFYIQQMQIEQEIIKFFAIIHVHVAKIQKIQSHSKD